MLLEDCGSACKNSLGNSRLPAPEPGNLRGPHPCESPSIPNSASIAPPVLDVRLNTDCRDEIIPILPPCSTSTPGPNSAIPCSMPSPRMSMGSRRADRGRPGMAVLVDPRPGGRPARVRSQLRPAPEPGRGASFPATDHGHRRLVRRPDVRLAMPPRQHRPAVTRHHRAAQPPDRGRGASARPRGGRDGPGRLVRRRHRHPLPHRLQPHRRRPPHHHARRRGAWRAFWAGRLASAQAPAPRREEAPPRHQPDRRGQGARLPQAASGRLPGPLRRGRPDHRPGDGVARSRPDLRSVPALRRPRWRGSGRSCSTS